MSDSIIYEAQPIPPEDPNDQSRKQRMAILGAIGFAVVLLLGIGLGTAIFNGSEDEPLADSDITPVTTPPTRDDVSTTTVAPSRSRSFGAEDSTGGYSIVPRGPRGEPTPPLPQADFIWQRIVLDLGAGGRNHIQQVTAVGNGFIATGFHYDEQNGTEQTRCVE